MKKLATKLLVCSLACSLLTAPVNASALDWEELLSEMDFPEEKVSSVSVEIGTSDLENIIEKAVANSVDKSVEKSMEKAALKVARDKKSVQNLVNESKKTSKGSALWKFVTFPFSAAWNVVKSVVVLALAVALPVGGIYAFVPSSRDAIKADWNNLFKTLKESNAAKEISELANVAYEKLRNIFSPTEEATTKQSSDSNDDETEETDESTESSSQEITNNTEDDESSQEEKIEPIVTE